MASYLRQHSNRYFKYHRQYVVNLATSKYPAPSNAKLVLLCGDMAKNKRKNAQKRAVHRRNDEKRAESNALKIHASNSESLHARPSLNSQKNIIVRLLQQAASQELQIGETRYLLSFLWWKAWCTAVNISVQHSSLVHRSLSPCVTPSAVESIVPKSPGLEQEIDIPSRIDNRELLIDGDEILDDLMGGFLRPELHEYRDFIFVPQEVWEALCNWYGGGPNIARFIVADNEKEQNGNRFGYRVELYPELDEHTAAEFEILDSSSSISSEQNYTASPEGDRVIQAEMQSCQDVVMASSDTVENEDSKEINAPVNDTDQSERKHLTIGPNAINKSCVVCETSNSEIKRCGGCRQTYYCSVRCQMAHRKYHQKFCVKSDRAENQNQNRSGIELQLLWQRPVAFDRRGKVGLANLGNTCFMNSAIQCLSHIKVVTNYFLSNRYQQDINRNNPLGSDGALAEAYGDLVKELWFGSTEGIAPVTLKHAIARFAPQFSGYQQHDAQELLAYLLDGLHEDLNRVSCKPYTQLQESDGRLEDAAVAEEAWRCHRLRNDSIFVDHVQGQFKSTVICPVCSRVSITFDPFNCIQLELPTDSSRFIEAIVIPSLADAISSLNTRNGKPLPLGSSCKMVRYAVQVPKNGLVRMLRKALSEICGIPAEQLIMAEIYQSMIYRIYSDDDRINSIRDDDHVIAYQIHPLWEGNMDYSTEAKSTSPPPSQSKADYIGFIYHQVQTATCGIPVVFSFTESTSCAEALHIWSRLLSSYTAQVANGLTLNRKVISPTKLAKRVFLVNAEGTLLRNVPVPASESVSLLDYLQIDDDSPLDERVQISVCKSRSVTIRDPFFIVLLWEPGFAGFDVIHSKLFHITDHDSVRIMERSSSNSNAVTLDACLQNFIKPEILDKENSWYCTQCKAHRQARKCIEIWKIPDVLILSLKRFEYRNAILRDKISVLVDFPIHDLDMAPYCLQARMHGEKSWSYDLFAVSNHYGGMGFGHYTAFARDWSTMSPSARKTNDCSTLEKDIANSEWFSFDDSHVSRMASKDVRTNAAYILYYKRK